MTEGVIPVKGVQIDANVLDRDHVLAYTAPIGTVADVELRRDC